MSQRTIEILVGRLITDEQFRAQFLRDPQATLAALHARGMELSRTEIAALLNTDSMVWEQAADALDARLQKVALDNHQETDHV